MRKKKLNMHDDHCIIKCISTSVLFFLIELKLKFPSKCANKHLQFKNKLQLNVC